MSGDDVRRARRRLCLSRVDVARILIVGESTVYRWETTAGPIKIDPLHGELVRVLRVVSALPNAPEIGDALRLAIPAEPIAALALLLRSYLERPSNATS